MNADENSTISEAPKTVQMLGARKAPTEAYVCTPQGAGCGGQRRRWAVFGASHYYMPPEWAPHRATWLAWPHAPLTWPGLIPTVEGIYVEMMAALVVGETVNLLVNDLPTERRVRTQLVNRGLSLDRVHLHIVPTNDAWMRDSGAIWVEAESDGKRGPLALDFDFNMWGGKYPPWDLDNAVPKAMAKICGLPRLAPGMILEGGSIDTNGEGLLLTTEQCLLNPNRNPTLSRGEIERRLKHYLGVKKVLWLGEGILGDDTDGHVDDIARFVSSRTVLAVRENDPSDPNFEFLEDNWQRLSYMTDTAGRPLERVALPMPKPVEGPDGRLPASYANFYIGNAVVLAPIFNDPSDAKALDTLRRLFPTRRIVGINCRALVAGLGAIHCVTQQEPLFHQPNT